MKDRHDDEPCRSRREGALTHFGFRISDFGFTKSEPPYVGSYKRTGSYNRTQL